MFGKKIGITFIIIVTTTFIIYYINLKFFQKPKTIEVQEEIIEEEEFIL